MKYKEGMSLEEFLKLPIEELRKVPSKIYHEYLVMSLTSSLNHNVTAEQKSKNASHP